MKKLIGFLLIICCIPLLSGCRWEGHRMLQKFMDDFTENNPYWWCTPDGEEKLKKAFEEKMTSDIEFARTASRGIKDTPFLSRTNRHVRNNFFIGDYTRKDENGKVIEYGERRTFILITGIRMKECLSNGDKIIYITYSVTTDIPAKYAKRYKIYVDNVNTCTVDKKHTYEPLRYRSRYTVHIGDFILSNEEHPDKLEQKVQQTQDTVPNTEATTSSRTYQMNNDGNKNVTIEHNGEKNIINLNNKTI